ncbi:hypothetical protein EV643_112103 [Kribbella sp. VKM Ac-2527]|uniref:Choice-of-anchor D domain-containing protein n=1 Tax=Kribbella caucasensis TaxID=2512215 RepID=A0A4R6K8B4_9ACTN|nr:hypothetical protein [Kribbella sp. VKM Ac-2527]TDO45779.1 hypothetical protein EV643_112103 [Kribbella sp. VKM Ac-2527]
MKRVLAVMLVCVFAVVGTAPSAVAGKKLATVAPRIINFGSVPVGTEVLAGAKITNTSGSDLLLLVEGGLPDDFGFGLLPGSTCPALTPGDILAADESCDVVVRFTPTDFFAGLRQTGTLTATVRDPTTGDLLSTLSITVVGRGLTP